MVADRYPKATWLGNGQSGGSYTDGPWKGVLHTTETSGLPSYTRESTGDVAPHITYDPEVRVFYQHTSFLTAARALKNESGGVETNRDRAIQLEIVCYSAKWIADEQSYRQWVGDLMEEQKQDIREFMLWASAEFGIEWKWPGKQAFSSTEANSSGFRMSMAEWDGYNGWCGHQHIPENDHWDPGAIDWDFLMAEEEVEMVLKLGDVGLAVTKYQERLLEWRSGVLPEFGADGNFGQETVRAVRKFQRFNELTETGQIDGITAALLVPAGPRGKRGLKGDPGDAAVLAPGSVLTVVTKEEPS